LISSLELDYQLNLNYLISLLFCQEILLKFHKHHQAQYQAKGDLSHHYNLHLMELLIKHFCLHLLDLYFFHLFSFYRLYSMQLQHCFVVLLFEFFFFLLRQQFFIFSLDQIHKRYQLKAKHPPLIRFPNFF